MSTSTPPLAERIRSRGYTPKQKEAAELLDLLATCDKDDASTVEKALLRLGGPLNADVAQRFEAASGAGRGRYLRLLARFEDGNPAFTPRLLRALRDADARTRRVAASALGKRSEPGVEEALVTALEAATTLEEKRVLVEALGKIGGAVALEAVRGVESDDPELARRRNKAKLMLERDGKRVQATRILENVAPQEPLRIVLRCRAGFEAFVESELGTEFAARAFGPGLVRAELRGELRTVFRSRTMLGFAFALPEEKRQGEGDTIEDAVVRSLTSPAAREVFTRFSEGPLRFRLAWADGAHHRATTWAIAGRLADAWPELINDAKEAPWSANVRETRDGIAIELAPQGLEDPRFRYRVADVPAASHPTVAAALVHLAGPRMSDVVWDPFVGSGMELVERGLASPVKRLIGSDQDPQALEMAFANLQSAGVTGELVKGDARRLQPEGVTLILTNPPMGRRVVHHAELGALLDAFIANAATVLVPGGRLVWLSPNGPRTKQRAEAAGLTCTYEGTVDMGGFPATMQRFEKPAERREAPPPRRK